MNENTKEGNPADMDSKVHIFPLIKKHNKFNSENKINIDEVSENELDEISEHYSKQLVYQLNNHGFNMDTSFFKDLEFVNQSIKSMLYRSMGKFHELQEFVDELYEGEIPEEPTEES